jgi:hypothetical protein
MATTIKSSALDFQNIKNNLKTYLEQQEEFKDYNFEASGLSNILDVLAYNTHINALTANFALNESFLGTAQLRSSLVSLSEGIGYIPDSKTSSEARVKLSLNLSSVADREVTISVASGYKFTTTVDETNYTFQTQETIVASDDGNGFYQFATLDGDESIPVFEGTAKQRTFVAGKSDENTVYIISDENIDIDTAVIRVYESATSTSSVTYTNILDATTINELSTLYILKEMPNGMYELSFGNGTTLGQTPKAGSKITVDYLSCNGSAANGATVFEAASQIEVTDLVSRTPTVTVTAKSAGGGEKESIESIRKNAPFQYAAQNRMVTHSDYSALVLRNFSTLIKDIIAWGGEDNLKPEFGTVFMSVLFNDDVTENRKTITKDSIQSLAEQLSVASFILKFDDPVTTFVELETFFQFNPRLTTLSLNTIQEQVRSTIKTYFTENVGKFGQSFRRSNMLSLVDDVSPAILSSRAEVKMQQRFTPTLTVEQDHSFSFPVAIATPDDVQYRVRSSSFTFNNQNCQIRNQLESNKLQVINLETNLPAVDNVGSYNATAGTVNIVGLKVDAISGNRTFVKLSVTPSNQSAITPERQYILSYDEAASIAKGVLVEAIN